MPTLVCWVPLPGDRKLGMMPRPQGGEDLEEDLLFIREQGVQVLASLLEPDEAASIGLAEEAALCAKHGITFLSFPVSDHDVPPPDGQAGQFAETLAQHFAQGKGVAVHCLAGIGRSGLMVSAVLIVLGMGASQAMEMASSARGFSVPETQEQRDWVRQFAARRGQSYEFA